MRRLIVALFVLAACGAPSLPQAHTVSLAYKQGDTYNYNLGGSLKYTIGTQGASLPLTVDMTAKEKVTVNSVDSSGVADLSVLLTDLKTSISANGTTTTNTTTTSTPIEMKVGSDGRIVSVNGNAVSNSSLPGMAQMGGGLVSAILPDGKVKPGDSWTKDYETANPAGSGTTHVTSKNKYLRDETVKGVTTAVIQSDIATNLDLTLDFSALAGGMFPSGGSGTAITLPTLTMKGTATNNVMSWIDASAKRLVKTHSTGSIDATMTFNTPAGGAPNPYLTGPITFKGTQTLDLNPA